MEIREAEKRAAELRAVIEKHNHNYYDLDSPTIEDDEYELVCVFPEAMEMFLCG